MRTGSDTYLSRLPIAGDAAEVADPASERRGSGTVAVPQRCCAAWRASRAPVSP
jgi:hypothetical protein